MPRGVRLTSTLPAEMLVHLLTQVNGVWALVLGLQKSDTRERTGVGCMKTAECSVWQPGESEEGTQVHH